MLLTFLEKIPDHRRAQGKRYQLKDILFVSILALLSGSISYVDIVRFSKARLKELNELFGMNWKRAPSKTHLVDILNGMDSKEIEKSFRAYSRKLSQLSDNETNFSIDGKTLRGSYDHTKGRSMLHILSIFFTNKKLILGHIDMNDKTNEIPTAQQFIKKLGLPEGSIYTLDAMHCQKKHLKRLKK